MLKKHISLLLALMLVVCLGGCSFGGNGNTSTTSDATNNSNVNMQFYEAAEKIIVNDLLKKYSVGRCGVNSEFDFSNTNKLTYYELSENYRYTVAFHNLYEKSYINSFNKNAFLNSYKEMFGISIDAPKNIAILTTGNGYELNNDSYVSVSGGYGCMSHSKYVLDNYEVTGNGISFSVIYYMIIPDTDNHKIFIGTSGNPHYTFETSSSTFENTLESDLQKIKENKDKFIQYKFNFKLNEDHFVFDSIEKINDEFVVVDNN